MQKFKQLEDKVFETGTKVIKKFFNNQAPRTHIFPPPTDRDKERFGLRISVGGVHDGVKTIHLQINRQASSRTLQELRVKIGEFGVVATGYIKMDTPLEDQAEHLREVFRDMREQAREKLG
jgi:hypothetical protein